MADTEDTRPPYVNGEVLSPLPPQRPPVLEPGQLGPDAEWPTLARFYATISAQGYHHQKAMYGELDEQRGGINHLGRLLHAQGQTIENVHTLLSAMVTPSGRSMPPMHDRRESNLDMIEQLTAEGLHKLRKRASETPGPGVGDAPEEVVGVFREMMETFVSEREARDKSRSEAAELALLRAENEARIENERVTRQLAHLNALKALVAAATTKEQRAAARVAIDDAVRRGDVAGQHATSAVEFWELAVKKSDAAAAKLKADRRKLATQIAVPLIVAFIGWIAAGAWADAKAKVEGDRRFAEGQQSAPVVVVSSPALPMVSASSVPPMATGAVAPATPRHP